jgi:hypothetical protein
MSDQVETKTKAELIRETQVKIHSILANGGEDIGGDRGVQMLCDICGTFAQLEIAAQLSGLNEKLTAKSLVAAIIEIQGTLDEAKS